MAEVGEGECNSDVRPDGGSGAVTETTPDSDDWPSLPVGCKEVGAINEIAVSAANNSVSNIKERRILISVVSG